MNRTKTLGWLVGAAALLFAGCSGENDMAREATTTEPTAQTQATVIRVTVGAGISDGEATTRSTVVKEGSTRTLQFSAGDKLYVWRELAGDETKHLAGELTMKDGSPTDGGTQATFEGELRVYDGQGGEADYQFGGEDPLEGSTATLIHAAMSAEAGDYSFNFETRALTFDEATGVAASVEALMTKGLRVSGGYDGSGFALQKATAQPILNCTIAGLTAGATFAMAYSVSADGSTYDDITTGTVTADAQGTATFACLATEEFNDGQASHTNIYHRIRLTNTGDGADTYDVSIGQKALQSKVYNAVRTAIGKKTPLTIEAITDGNIRVQSPKSGMKVKKNDEATVTLGTDDVTIDVAKGDKVQFYGNGTSITKYLNTYISGGTATVKVYGNIMSLVNETGFATATTLASDYAFMTLFTNNDKLTDASGLLLPATTLNTACYEGMFIDCTCLTAAPALPAETLANNCYQQMFKNCTSLTTAPALDATTLTLQCYEEMFSGCTSLTTAPVLPAETLVRKCYNQMFKNCTKLNAVKCLATNISAAYCTSGWLNGVAATGTFTKASTMESWPTNSASGIPENWTVENAQ